MGKRIVIKIGTGVLSTPKGRIDESILEHIVTEIASQKKRGVEVVLVTSGAVGSGRGLLPASGRTETVTDKQVFAAVGQVKLMGTYAKLFEKRGYLCAQVLVTKEDFRDRGHYHNMRRCFLNLLRDGIVPIVNENDVIAIKELVFTDNDELAGLVASQLEADAVIILTSVDGVLDGDPQNQLARTIPRIDSTTLAAVSKRITSEKTAHGRGGMMTKFAIAKKLMSSGITVHIANGKKSTVLRELLDGGKVGTTFVPNKKTSGVKRRLAYSEGLAMGALILNACASDLFVSKERAMSLLPVGITRTEGEFCKGDVVEIRNQGNKKIGFGISAMDSKTVKECAGKKGGKTVVHYDYMFIE